MFIRPGRVAVPLFGAALVAGLCAMGAPAQAASGLPQAAPAAGKPAVPAVATSVGPALKIYGADGSLRASRSGIDDVSLAPGLLAGTSESSKDKPWTLVGVDPVTGARAFSVPNGRLPVIVGDGPRVLFAPDPLGDRDPQDNSVWIREASGTVRRVVQFSNGPGLPGYDPGLDGEGTVLGFSVDRAGSTMAITEGNDVDAFIYDVFAVDVAKGGVVRVTSGRKSRHATISADGSKVAYDREFGACGKPYIRASDLVVAANRHFRTKTTLVKGTCNSWVSSAAWVSPRTLIAVRAALVGSKRTTEVVAVDVLTKHVYPLTTVHDVFLTSAGLTNHVVAYQRDGATSSTVLTLSISSRKGTVTVLRSAAVPGEFPIVAGDNRL